MSTLDAETADLIIDIYRDDEVVSPVKSSDHHTAQSVETASAVEPPTIDSLATEPEQKETMPIQTTIESEDLDQKRLEPPAVDAEVLVEAQAASNGKVVQLPEALTVKDLAEALELSTKDVLLQLMSLGTVASINHVINLDMANAVVKKLGKAVTLVAEGSEDFAEELEPSEEEHLEDRAPVVTIMGHVDHGKTSLLDAIREANVQATESGGITQHIGAYEVQTPRGRLVFLDTPGHEAFTAMRARGAQVTDIVVLVVAANDGVMPQTREAVDHAKAAGVPIVVAVNKIDLADANPDRVKQQLSELDLIPEEWGGTTIYVEVSAKEELGLDDLLEMVLLQAEILELQADPYQMSRGTVVEARLDKAKGALATVLIQRGTLRVGATFVAGMHYGRVRAMFDHRGRKMEIAGPSTPVEVLGFTSVPEAGDTFMEVADERKARQISNVRQEEQRAQQLSQTNRITLDDLYRRISAGDVKDLNLILKGDVQGSVQALWEAIEKIESDKVQTRLIHGSTGGITESDINLASASNAIVIGFNVRPTPQASELAAQEQVDIRLYTVIYEVISDIRAAMEGMLEPTYTERTLGRAQVRQIFHIARVGTIAGCFMQEGSIRRNASVRLVRDSVVIHQGRVGSLRRVKDDVDEVQSGFECGIGLYRFNDIKEGDVIEAYMLEEAAPTL
ncbi:MAG: translation initiation factor IF-2 [Candidatus Entotheonella factor]|uniref:Translation initiation factor IF-2 n=1 Tax=Entotheonella factor TaxID=1429438 RepID=W4LRA6_ENTF1|nr:MAG: translation initiation factor IF-2 [Candidatus Entotheonella factor]